MHMPLNSATESKQDVTAVVTYAAIAAQGHFPGAQN